MESRDIFKNISPLDSRYAHSNPELFDRLSSFLSEDASVRACIEVEVALFLEHLSHFYPSLPSDEVDALVGTMRSVGPQDVYEEEKKTRHNIRALVNVLQRSLPEEYRRLVHLGATSADILDSSTALRYRRLVSSVILPLFDDVLTALIRLSREHAELIQVGRTHGQFAVPITVGFALAEYVSRLALSVARIEELSRELRGKLAGAVGAYNALRLISENPRELEARVLGRLDLEAADHATQIVQPEFLLRLLLEINVAFGIVANLADDLRHLQRSEIGEFREYFSPDQVGSSTMPQKRNPWNSEHVKSLWKAFSPRVVSFYMDQISEHQRDLSNSASSRFVADYVAGVAAAASRMVRILEGLTVDRTSLERNLRTGGDAPLAEAAYILLALDGHGDAHEKVRVMTLRCRQEDKTLLSVIQETPEVAESIEKSLLRAGLGTTEEFFSSAQSYRGVAAQVAIDVCNRAEEQINSRREGNSGDA